MTFYSWGIKDESMIKAKNNMKLKEGTNEMKAMKAKSEKTYTKKQICEAIAYWKKQLEKIDEDNSTDVSNLLSSANTFEQFAIALRNIANEAKRKHMSIYDVELPDDGDPSNVGRSIVEILDTFENLKDEIFFW